MTTPLMSDAQLLEQIEAYCERAELSLTTFGRLSIGDGNLVPNLRSGRSLTLKTARKVLDFIAQHAASSSDLESAAA